MWTHNKNTHRFFCFICGAMLALVGFLWINPLQAATDTPDKLVPINTIDSQSGSTGISVQINRFCGDGSSGAPTCFYKNPGPSSNVHLLVLDQKTLQPYTPSGQSGANLTFSTDSSGLADLNSVLTGLKADSAAADQVLVMLVYNSSDPVAFSSIVQGLEAIGQQVVPPEGRPWSIIGVPGMVPGKAAWNLAEEINGSSGGGLKGYIRESWLYQNGQQFQHRLFDFGYAKGYTVTPVADASEAQSAKVELDGQIHSPPAVPAGSSAGGFYAVQFNTTTLESSERAFWISNDTGCVDFAELNSFLSEFAPPTLNGVALASLGKAWTEKSGCNADDWKQLLETLELLGLNPDIFARAVNTNLSSPYSMISSNGRFGRGFAYEASAVFTDWVAIQTGNTTGAEALPQADGILAGALRRNNVLGQIYPATGDPAGLYTTEFEEILVEDPIDWPMTPQPGATATSQETAFGWVVSCSQEVMTTEWSSGTPSSNEVVRQTSLTLRESYIDVDFEPKSISPLPSTCDGSSFSQTELSNAVSQLTEEFNDRTSIQSFFKTLLKPLADNTTTLFEDITNVAQSIANDELNADTTLTPSNTSYWLAAMFADTFQGLKVAINFFGFGPEVNVIRGFLSIGSAGGRFVLDSAVGAPSGQANQTDEYLILQSQLSVDSTGVTQQVEDSISQWRDSMGTSQAAILQDWGRMKAVSANLVAGGQWLFTEDDVNTMANAWDIVARQQTYYAYWPLLYNVGAARVSGDGSAPGASFPNTWFCSGTVQQNNTDGDLATEDIQPFVNNGGITQFENANTNTGVPSMGAFCDQGACGIGDGQTYLPLFDIFSDKPEQLVVYMFKKSWDLSYISGWAQPESESGTKGQGYANIIPASTMTNLSDQITENSADTAANFYPPTFWFKARSPNQLACDSASNAKLISTGFYSDTGTPSVMQTVSTSDSTTQNSTAPSPIAATPRALGAGDFISVGITVQNVIQKSDFYMGALLPDGDTVFFVTALDPLTLQQASLDNPESYLPLADREVIPHAVTAHLPNLVTYRFTGAEPDGTYQFFSAIVRKDAFSDGRFNERDLLSVDMDPFTVGSSDEP